MIVGICGVLKFTKKKFWVAIKTSILVLILLVVFDFAITKVLVYNMANKYIKNLSNLERQFIGQKIDYTIMNTFPKDSGEFEKHYNISKNSVKIDVLCVLQDASNDINLYLINDNIIEKALLFNNEPYYNIIIVNPETKKRGRPETRYKRVMGGTKKYIASLPEEIVFWKFIDVRTGNAYEFTNTYRGNIEGIEISRKRDEFYSDFIDYFKETRRQVVKEKIFNKYFPSYIISRFYGW